MLKVNYISSHDYNGSYINWNCVKKTREYRSLQELTDLSTWLEQKCCHEIVIGVYYIYFKDINDAILYKISGP